MGIKSKPWERLTGIISHLSAETGLPITACADIIIQGCRSLNNGGKEKEVREVMLKAAHTWLNQ